MASGGYTSGSYEFAVGACVVCALLGIAGVVAGSILIAEYPLPYNTTWWWGENSTWNNWWSEPFNQQWYFGWGVTILVGGIIFLICAIAVGACAACARREPERPHPVPCSYAPNATPSKAGPPPPYKG